MMTIFYFDRIVINYLFKASYIQCTEFYNTKVCSIFDWTFLHFAMQISFLVTIFVCLFICLLICTNLKSPLAIWCVFLLSWVFTFWLLLKRQSNDLVEECSWILHESNEHLVGSELEKCSPFERFDGCWQVHTIHITNLMKCFVCMEMYIKITMSLSVYLVKLSGWRASPWMMQTTSWKCLV